jgi:adenylate cyclase class IV
MQNIEIKARVPDLERVRHFLHDSEMEGSGQFVELATVLGEQSMSEAWAEHQRIVDVLHLQEHPVVSVSYSDLMID